MIKRSVLILFFIINVSTSFADQGRKMGCVDQHGIIFPIGGKNHVDGVVYECVLTFTLQSDHKKVNGYAVVNQASWVLAKTKLL
ncbi:MAG: hypothetical protein WBC60_01220 [Cognaticolwellia sp.]